LFFTFCFYFQECCVTFSLVVIVTSSPLSGMMGLVEAYAPFTPWAHVPLLLMVGSIKQRPAVDEESGAVVARPTLTLTVTLDHRFADGSQVFSCQLLLHYQIKFI
jgi:hypothetical protein